MYKLTLSITDLSISGKPLHVHGDVSYDPYCNTLYVVGTWVYQWGSHLSVLSEHMDKRIKQLCLDGNDVHIVDLEKCIQSLNIYNANIVFT